MSHLNAVQFDTLSHLITLSYLATVLHLNTVQYDFFASFDHSVPLGHCLIWPLCHIWLLWPNWSLCPIWSMSHFTTVPLAHFAPFDQPVTFHHSVPFEDVYVSEIFHHSRIELDWNNFNGSLIMKGTDLSVSIIPSVLINHFTLVHCIEVWQVTKKENHS